MRWHILEKYEDKGVFHLRYLNDYHEELHYGNKIITENKAISITFT